MRDNFMIMNRLYELILADQINTQLPDEDTPIHQHARAVMEPLASIAIRATYSNGGNKHETMLQLAKLYTAGLITFDRAKGGDFTVKGVKNPDMGLLEDFNENLQK